MPVDHSERLIVVSSDAHAGPSLENSLRPYCPAKYLPDYDAYVAALRSGEFARGERNSQLTWADIDMQRKLVGPTEGVSDSAMSAEANDEYGGIKAAEREMYMTHPAHDDPHARLQAMDDDGVSAEVIFAGGQNRELSPFIGFGADAGSTGFSPELRHVGNQIWNRWLADHIAADPHRLIGVMQVPIWDIDEAVAEIRRGRAAGLTVVNFPAPRADFPSYNHPMYEPLWNVCEELDAPLATHAGGGENPSGFGAAGWDGIRDYEKGWLTRRALHQMIFGGVFERHPKLRFILTELRGGWLPQVLKDLDATYRSWTTTDLRAYVPHLPSEYWARNCFNSGSFLARFEVQACYDNNIGIDNLMWGRDFPHFEGTWPNTLLAIRNTLGGFPDEDVAKILGTNGLRAYGLDRDALSLVAAKVGPTLEEIGVGPLPVDVIPSSAGLAFRQWGEND